MLPLTVKIFSNVYANLQFYQIISLSSKSHWPHLLALSNCFAMIPDHLLLDSNVSLTINLKEGLSIMWIPSQQMALNRSLRMKPSIWSKVNNLGMKRMTICISIRQSHNHRHLGVISRSTWESAIKVICVSSAACDWCIEFLINQPAFIYNSWQTNCHFLIAMASASVCQMIDLLKKVLRLMIGWGIVIKNF